jgi:hypothetical protein
MDAQEERKIVNEIIKDRRLSYSIQIKEVDGDKFVVETNFGSTITYIKKGDNYFLEGEV